MNVIAYVLKKVFSVLVLPPVGLMLLALIGLLVMRRRRMLGKSIIYFSAALTLALSTSMVSRFLLTTLQNFPALDANQPQAADAIVVLAGGIREMSVEYGSDQLNDFTLERLRYGAWLARRTGLPILVTGGYKYDGPTEAEIMASTLKDEYGLTPRWVETKSRDTADNATLSAALLRASNASRILLVTHAWHMRRAVAEFSTTPLQVTPAPTVFVRGATPSTILGFVPNGKDLFQSTLALHEWIGLTWARVKRLGA